LESVSLLCESGVDPVICLGQWDITKNDIRGLNSLYTLAMTFTLHIRTLWPSPRGPVWLACQMMSRIRTLNSVITANNDYTKGHISKLKMYFCFLLLAGHKCESESGQPCVKQS
jgi:hypothetical protein